MSIYRTFLILTPFTLFLLADVANAGVIITATTRSEGAGLNIGRASNATVQGWFQGDLGKIEYLGKPGDVTSKGNVILTSDGGLTATYYDITRKNSCRPWTGNAVVIGSGSNSTSSRTISGLEIQKLVDEPGPEIAGFATHHFQFRVSFASALNSADLKYKSKTELVEDLWVAQDLSNPALRIWLDNGTWPSGDQTVDEQIAETLAEANGVPLKRVSKLSVHPEKGRESNTTISLEVNTVETREIPAELLKAPFRCAVNPSEVSN